MAAAAMPTFAVHDAPPQADSDVVDDGIGDFNIAAAPLHLVVPLAAFARNGSKVIGGAVGRTWGRGCELQQLWVDGAWRRKGIGTQLVRLFEARAIERGCDMFYLYTFTFQAPALYASLGYQRAHALRGYPDGIEQYLMTKTVARSEGNDAAR